MQQGMTTWRRPTITAGAAVALLAGVAIGAAALSGGQEPAPAPAPVEVAGVASVDTTTTTAVSEPAPVETMSVTGAPQEPAPTRQEPGAAPSTTQEPPVTTTQEQPVTTTQEQPVTTKPRPATSAAPRMPWCYHPEMGWYSGEGEGCTPTSSYFVEYR